MVTTDRECRYCHETFTPPKPETTLCRSCYYEGRHLREHHADLIGRLGDLDTVATANVWHTGGGCFGLAVTLQDERLFFGTVAMMELDENGTAVWRGDAWIPTEPEERWMIGVYASEAAFSDGEEPTRIIMPATDDEFVAAVQEA